MRSAVTAAARLRAEVLQMDGIILIEEGGKPDRVIQVNPLPDYLVALREEQRNERRPKKFVRDNNGHEYFESIPLDQNSEQKHVHLNLGKMPHQEAWKLLEREINLRCPRDRTLPTPISVADNIRDEWGVMPEDVPSVDFSQVISSESDRPLRVPLEEIASFQCSECESVFPKKQGLLMHIRHRHPQKTALDAREAKKAETEGKAR